MPEVIIPTQQGGMPAYVARPSGEGPWPGVIVIHDIFGMTTDQNQHADWLADQGYLANSPKPVFTGAEKSNAFAQFSVN